MMRQFLALLTCKYLQAKSRITGARHVRKLMAEVVYIVPSGEVIPYGNTKIQNSQDQDFHWCTQGGKENTPTVCLYVPGRGS